MNRKDRRAGAAEGNLNTTSFLKVADKFIDVANRENKKIKATDLQMAFLYAAARYNAFVAKHVINVEKHEDFVQKMVAEYQDMLRQNLADEALSQPPESPIK